jgi:uncharacterized membrane protein (DUF373 family)
MEKFLKHFERYIVIGLLGMMVVVVFLGTVELGVILVEQMLEPPRFILLDINEMLKIFGFFMMILIGLELIESIKVYLVEETVHVEIILLVAIIAIARKVIVLDVKTAAPLTLIGVAAIILALSAGYLALKKALGQKNKGQDKTG